MKRLLLILLIILIAFPAYAQDMEARLSLGIVGGGVTAAPGCDPNTNEVGNRTEYGSGHPTNLDYFYCFPYSADCSGTLSYASIGAYDASHKAKVCIYTFDMTTKIGCSNEILLTDSYSFKESTAEVGGSVTNITTYYVCGLTDGSSAIARTTSGTKTMKSCFSSGSYASPPNDISAWGWEDTGNIDASIFIKIK